MNLAAALKPFLRPPDPRSEREIDSDLDDEFAFHLEQIERELTEADPTLSHDEAARLARLRFGDTDQLKKRCRRIAMEDRIMLQRFNAVLMVVVMLMVIGVSAQMYITQRYNSLALQAITMELASMRVETGARRYESRLAAPDEDGRLNYADQRNEPTSGVIYIGGSVARPGVYHMPQRPLTLSRVLVASGVDRDKLHVIVRRTQPDGSQVEVLNRVIQLSAEHEDPELEPNDFVLALPAEQNSDPRKNVNVVPLRFINAQQAKEALIARLGPLATDPDRPAIAIVPDDRTNSLIIACEPNLWGQVVEMLKTIDAGTTGERTGRSEQP
ncbi:MAG TPA: secretin N-terminal domain-containing protein [Phycisphaerales bacterium]|nr:secretin N-terminal domain-containing protein [Phycisphaerales bacterium]